MFVCQECGHTSVRWLGKCPECGQWNTYIEESVAGPETGRGMTAIGGTVQNIDRITGDSKARVSTGIAELDRVLGGGVVAGSVVLIGGEPGVGKTTLLLQAMASIVERGKKVLYVSGEESPLQIKVRAERIGSVRKNILVLVENCLENIMEEVRKLKPDVVVIDSVQAVASSYSPSPPGTIAQVREVANRVITFSKKAGTSTFLVGHVTKEGSIAGPKVLEHMVDTVLYFEGDMGHLYRIVRASKNRFGSTNEVGIFRMGDDGLREVENLSTLFIGNEKQPQPGTAVIPSLEGRRPILVEVQALVSPSAYATGRRSVSGLELNRVIMLLAVLEKKAGLVFGSSDVYVNAAGGLRLVEPAADLGVLLALASSHRNISVGEKTAAFGEISLTGEIRGVSGSVARIKEVSNLGFKRCILPAAARGELKKVSIGTELLFVDRVESAIDLIDE